MPGMGLTMLLVMFLFFLITVAILRWILRINDIVKRLDGVCDRLDSVINALKVGMNIEETK
jgi:hypothetical protein